MKEGEWYSNLKEKGWVPVDIGGKTGRRTKLSFGDWETWVRGAGKAKSQRTGT